MSRKKELQDQIMEMQRQYGAASKELKEIVQLEQDAAMRERYKEYAFKVQHYNGALDSEERISEVEDGDRERARLSSSGFVVSDADTRAEVSYVMMKSKDEYKRLKRLFDVINAVSQLNDKNTKERDKLVRFILGEEAEVQS